ncbi:MAG: hypothetical protein PHX93_00305 [Candidatus Peribacteraceae bacterium]|nr:hypothetical protein [Candidatus Peribacteraceae bacterium]
MSSLQKTLLGTTVFAGLLLVLPQNAGAVSSWNPGLLANTEAFQVIDDADTDADVQLKFGETLQESLTYNRGESRFEFTRSLQVGGNLTATGSLNVLGTMSGKSLQVTGTGAAPLIYTDQTTGRVGIGTVSPTGKLSIIDGNGTAPTTTAALTIATGVGGGSTPLVVKYQDNEDSQAGMMMMETTEGILANMGAGGTNVFRINAHEGNAMALTVNDRQEGIRITAAGNVGIGTAAPETKLEVTGTASGNYVFGQQGLGASGAVVIKKLAGTGTGNIFIVDTQGLVYDATNKRVGIGTASPAQALEVVSTIQTSGAASPKVILKSTGTNDADGGEVQLFESNGTYGWGLRNVTQGDVFTIGKYTNGSWGERLRIGQKGQLIIQDGGTFVTAVGDEGILFDTNAGQDGIEFISSVSGAGYGHRILDVDGGAGAALLKIQERLNSGTFSDVVSVTNSLVGIGTTAPETKLEVVGTMSGKSLQVTGTGAAPLIYTDQTTGRVGIGTASPEQALHMNGHLLLNNNNEIRFKDSGGIQRTVFELDPNNDLWYGGSMAGSVIFAGGGSYTERMKIDDDGDIIINGNNKVGIGTTAPETRLEVTGTASGDLLHAQRGLTSSGSLAWEGTASGASLWISKLEGAGLADCDTSDTSKLLWDATTGRFSCGTDQTGASSGISATTAEGMFVNQGGDTMTGALTINEAGASTNDLLLNVLGTMSGRSLQVTGTGAAPLIFTDTTTGRVGIGTASPTDTNGFGRALDIQSSNGGGAYFRDSDDTGKYATIGFAGSLGYIGTYGASTALSIQTSGSEKVRVDTSGNVGIGTTTPNAKLSVAGTASGRILSFGDRLTGSGAVSIRTLTDSTTAFQVLDSDGGTPVFNIDTTNERIGIGTAALETALEVVGTMSGKFLRVTGTGASPMIYAHTSNGNVGIGTASPESKLHVSGVSGVLFKVTGASYPYWMIEDTTAGHQAFMSYRSDGNMFFDNNYDFTVASQTYANRGTATADTPRFKIKGATGNVGIGTTAPNAKLSVAGTASGRILSFGERLTGSGAVSIRTATDSTTAFQVLDSDGGTPVFNIDTTNERVGIGKSNPYYPLDVVGEIRSNDEIRIYKNGSDSVTSGANYYLANDGNTRAWTQQLGADNDIDYWYYDGSSWERKATMQTTGNLGLGTTAPETKLEVVGTISGSQLRMGNATTSGSIVYSSGSTLMATAKGASGQVLVSKGTGTPLWQAPTSAMLWYIDGSLAIGTKQGATVVMPFGFTCTDVDLRVDTAPVGTDLIVDINKDGGTIFSTRPQITDSQTSEAGTHAFSTTDLPAGSAITLDIDQVGGGTAGSDLTVILKGTRKYP